MLRRSTIALLLALGCSSGSGPFHPPVGGDFRGTWSFAGSQFSCGSELSVTGPNEIRLQRSGSTISGSWSTGSPGCHPAQGMVSGYSGRVTEDAIEVVLTLHPAAGGGHADPVSALTGGIPVDGCAAAGTMTLTGAVTIDAGVAHLDVEGDVLSVCPFAPEGQATFRLRFAGVA